MLKIDNERGIELADVMADPVITTKAKGVFAYLATRGVGSHVTLDGMIGNMAESVASVRNAVKELEVAGYLVRIRDNSKGHAEYDWILKM